jgi:hypothetical protein
MGSLFLPGPGPWEPPPLVAGTSGPTFTAVTADETLALSDTATRAAQSFTRTTSDPLTLSRHGDEGGPDLHAQPRRRR